MKKRSWIIWLVGLALIVSPIYYYAMRVMTTPLSFTDPVAVIASITPARLVAIALGPVVGFLVLRVRPISWYALVSYVGIAAGIELWLTVKHGLPPMALLASLPVDLLVILYFVRSEIRSPYFNPRLRWWETHRIRFRTKVELKLPIPVVAETYDISETGLFVCTDATIPPGSNFDLVITLGDKPISARAECVWVSDGAVRPRGIGARFAPASRKVVGEVIARDQREHERLPVSLRVDIAGKESLECKTFDISRGGCFLVTDTPFTLGEKLSLSLRLNDVPVKLDGTVSWLCDGKGKVPRGVGMRFDRPWSRGDEWNKLKDLVSQLHTRAQPQISATV